MTSQPYLTSLLALIVHLFYPFYSFYFLAFSHLFPEKRYVRASRTRHPNEQKKTAKTKDPEGQIRAKEDEEARVILTLDE